MDNLNLYFHQEGFKLYISSSQAEMTDIITSRMPDKDKIGITSYPPWVGKILSIITPKGVLSMKGTNFEGKEQIFYVKKKIMTIG